MRRLTTKEHPFFYRLYADEYCFCVDYFQCLPPLNSRTATARSRRVLLTGLQAGNDVIASLDNSDAL